MALQNSKVKTLAASEIRYRRVFEAAKDGILILDGNGGEIIDVNPFLVELTGYSHEEFLGKHLWELGPFKDIAHAKKSFSKLQAQNYVRYEDLPLETRDGRKIDVEFVSNVYMAGKKKMIQCNIRDITLRKRAERAILREKNLNQTIIDTLPGTFSINDEQGHFLQWNQVLLDVTGYTGEEISHMTAADLFGDQGKNIVSAGIRDVLLSGSVIVEANMVAKDGTQTAYMMYGRRIQLDGRTCLIGLGLDISKQRKADEQQRLLTTAIEQVDEVVIVADLQGNILYVNPAFVTLTGYTSAEVLGLNPRFLNSGAHDDAFYSHLWETILSGKTWRGRDLPPKNFPEMK